MPYGPCLFLLCDFIVKVIVVLFLFFSLNESFFFFSSLARIWVNTRLAEPIRPSKAGERRRGRERRGERVLTIIIHFSLIILVHVENADWISLPSPAAALMAKRILWKREGGNSQLLFGSFHPGPGKLTQSIVKPGTETASPCFLLFKDM